MSYKTIMRKLKRQFTKTERRYVRHRRSHSSGGWFRQSSEHRIAAFKGLRRRGVRRKQIPGLKPMWYQKKEMGMVTRSMQHPKMGLAKEIKPSRGAGLGDVNDLHLHNLNLFKTGTSVPNLGKVVGYTGPSWDKEVRIVKPDGTEIHLKELELKTLIPEEYNAAIEKKFTLVTKKEPLAIDDFGATKLTFKEKHTSTPEELSELKEKIGLKTIEQSVEGQKRKARIEQQTDIIKKLGFAPATDKVKTESWLNSFSEKNMAAVKEAAEKKERERGREVKMRRSRRMLARVTTPNGEESSLL
jgi:hypothetical protein